MKDIWKVVSVWLLSLVVCQPSYATPIKPVAETKTCSVAFMTQDMSLSSDQDIKIEANVSATNTKKLLIDVKNIYPGGSFKIKPVIINNGQLPVKITGITFYPLYNLPSENEGEKRLYEHLLIFNEKGEQIEKGINGPYQTMAYVGEKIDIGKSIEFYLHMMLDPKITDLQNTVTQFAIEVNFEQYIKDKPPVDPPIDPPVNPPVDPPVDPPVNPPVNPPVDPTVNPSVDPSVDPSVNLPVDSSVDLPINPPVESTDATGKTIPRDKLPKTGGVLPIIFYLVGLISLTLGVLIRKYAHKE